MANTTKSALSNEKELNLTPLFQDFVIELSPSLLQQIMRSYKLKANDIVGNYAFDVKAFNEIMDAKFFEIENIDLKQLVNVMTSWPKQLNWRQFNHQVNKLLLAWLNDYKLGASLDAALFLVSCFTL